MYLDRKLIQGDERLAFVLEELGYTTGAGYQIWANQAAFREDLRDYVAENLDYRALATQEEVEQIAGQNLEFGDYVAELARRMIYRATVEEFYLSLRFYALNDDERTSAITRSLRSTFRYRAEFAEALIKYAVDAYGKILPADSYGLAVSVIERIDGHLLAWRICPEQTDPTRAAVGISADVQRAVEDAD
jgi:hypothetical protein